MEAGTEAPQSPQASPEGAPQPPEATEPQEGGTLSGQPLRDAGEGTRTEHVGGAAAVAAAARGQRLTEGEQSEALKWFMTTEIDPSEAETKVLELNFGTSDRPRTVPWTIRPVGMDAMREIRNRAQNSRTARRTGRIDEYRMNLEVVVAGTADPPVAKAAQELFKQGIGSGDAADMVREKFQYKPGFIAQIAAEIMSLSGFDDADVTEKEQVEAAGNS